MRVEFINPFLTATQNVFQTALGNKLTRGPLALKKNHSPSYEVSGLIGMAGNYHGMVVVSIGRSTAISIAEIMLGARPEHLNADVLDAVGEVTNMIAGAAKSQLEGHHLSIGLPTVICGKSHSIQFPSGSQPLAISFASDVGPVCVEVGLVESSIA